MDILSYLMGYKAGKSAGGGSGGGGGGSSGGGSLPAGLYLEPMDIQPKNTYQQSWFELNGELYCLTGTVNGNGNGNIFYKWNPETRVWTEVLKVSSGGVISQKLLAIVGYNGKIHFGANDAYTHWVFDGASLVRKNDMPAKCYTQGNMMIYQGKLTLCSSNSGAVCQWDEATDSWTTLATTNKTYRDWVVVNGELYCIDGQTLCRFDGSALVSVATLNGKVSTTYSAWANGNCVYWVSSYSNATTGGYTCTAYKFDVTTNTETKVGYMPYGNYGLAVRDIGGSKVLVYGDNSGTSYGYTPYILHEIEAAE